MQVSRSQNPKAEAEKAILSALQASKSVPVLFLSAGGSAIDILPKEIPKIRMLTLSVLDERYTEDTNNRNFQLFSKTEFFRSAVQNGADTFDPYNPKVSLEECGTGFSDFFEQWMRKNPDGKIISTLGMGTDGHISGIMSGDKDEFEKRFVETQKFAVGYTTDKHAFTKRITSTFPLLARLDEVIFYAVDKDKREKLQTLERENRPVNEFPAMFLKTLPSVHLFTDL